MSDEAIPRSRATSVAGSVTPAYTVYFAGALFTYKDLLGNALLASAIEAYAASRYVCCCRRHFDRPR